MNSSIFLKRGDVMVTSCLIEPGLLLYILLGAVAGIIYSLRRIFKLEKLILAVDNKIEKQLEKKGGSNMAARKRAAAKKRKR
ncbi:MAG: hypothetical protein AABW58_01985 [Nanoarchaeota archaeon]